MTVQTSSVKIGMAREVSDVLGTEPTFAKFNQVDANSVSSFNPTVETTERNPVTSGRFPKKAIPTSQTSGVEFEADITYDFFREILQHFLYSDFVGGRDISVSAVTGTGYTVPSGAVVPQNDLYIASGFDVDANNGLKVIAATSTAASIKATGLTAEASTTNGRLRFAGKQISNLVIDADGNLTGTGLPSDLVKGQYIYVHDPSVVRTPANAGDMYARVSSATSTKITIDRWGTKSPPSAKTITTAQIFYSAFVKTVEPSDNLFNKKGIFFEREDIGRDDATPTGGKAWDYASGNRANQLEIRIPVTDKATVSPAYVGLNVYQKKNNSGNIIRLPGASSSKYPTDNAYNTATNVPRLRLSKKDGTPISLIFTDMNLTLNNNVTPENVIGRFAAHEVNIGQIAYTFSATALFENSRAIEAIKDNTSLEFEMMLDNEDGGFLINIPTFVLGDGSPDFQQNQSVRLNLSGTASADLELDFVMAVSDFAHLPDITFT